VRDALSFIERHALFTRQGRKEVRQVNVTGLVAAAFTHRDSRAGDPDLHTHVAVANKVQTLDGRWLSIDGRVLSKATVAPVVMLPLASLSWTVILEVESPRGARLCRSSDRRRIGAVPCSRPITLRAKPHRIGWHGGSAGVHRAHSDHDQQDHSRAR
jgi:TrwC relaxase